MMPCSSMTIMASGTVSRIERKCPSRVLNASSRRFSLSISSTMPLRRAGSRSGPFTMAPSALIQWILIKKRPVDVYHRHLQVCVRADPTSGDECHDAAASIAHIALERKEMPAFPALSRCSNKAQLFDLGQNRTGEQRVNSGTGG